MRRLLFILVPLSFLLLAFSLMVGGSWLKQPMNTDDDVHGSIQRIEQLVADQKWEEAKQEQDSAQKAWDRISNRIQFSVERETMFEISGSLARIKGSLEAEDKQGGLTDIYYFYHLWANLG